jgi:hypothetical protein
MPQVIHIFQNYNKSTNMTNFILTFQNEKLRNLNPKHII